MTVPPEEDVEAAAVAAVLAERVRAVAYLREMSEPGSGYYAASGGEGLKIGAVVRRLATDLSLGEHVKPERVHNPELWR